MQEHDFSRWFQLEAFSGCKDANVRGRFAAFETGILIEFDLQGDFIWPEKFAGLGQRRDELWKSDCFEFFWSFDEVAYCELNVSLDGDWQIYQFTGERNGRTDSLSRVTKVSLEKKASNRWSMRIEVQVQSKPHLVGRFQIATILRIQGELEYFALKHGRDRPDFHNMSLWRTKG